MLNYENEIKIFVDSLLSTNRGYDFYVNWKHTEEVNNYNIEFHALDSLIKCDEFEKNFYDLLDKLPSVVSTFPFLFALSRTEREKLKNGKSELEIIDYMTGVCEQMNFDIEKAKQGYTKEEKEKYYQFFIKMGLKNLFQNIIEKSVVDYVVGILVGLDSNGRKNRSGTSFEKICEKIIKPLCDKYGIELLVQEQFKILKNYGMSVDEDIKNRKADFILIKGNIAMNIETNYYFTAGSKPEEIVDSYINRYNDLKNNNMYFSLITDGNCWNNEHKNQLNKAFKYISIMNYKMACNGYLESRIKDVFDKN